MKHHEFGDAVRQLRESTAPSTVGLPVGRRRVRGLRREELGELAGMSADYVRRLEQGRSHPSAGVVNAIARALRVGRADYERLCGLAGYAAVDGQVPAEIGPGAARLLERFTDTPMFVSDAAMNIIAVNSAFLALGHWELTGDPWDWNVAWRTFCDPFHGFRQSAADATDHETVLVARLRAALLRYPADAQLAALIDETRSRSGLFDTLWREPRPVTAYESSAAFVHPDGGAVTLVGNLLAIPGDDLAALMLTAAPGSADAARLAELVDSAGEPTITKVGRRGPG
ncbi:helix-turn-helix domain-containing protein [Actinosynnema pretiosum subsp. pretiosum]|uniref:Transcriptional regulator, XRE family n=2 Tax=Actinosynnema TaxID=40566 RepID=C6WEH8_ACTMD|nr:helix-turn-helix domain-containing protein [Actinosynnema mirum]ACU37778.1 transcriptional regulator, XRE family [Actinosynnema mirum DSM 43827]AXX31257.1 putative DNA-binding protein [Actinosynnema pretiosum subsp. pretiosum]QUF04676.1 helix-turn-helix domain-containing protein [Actinosynnema pretiosum subsp. pretiosum]